mgnify:CR=1 FL=1
MTKSINQKILEYLKLKQDFITAENLSSEIGVARKTIIRHIKAINDQANSEVIASKKGRGYKLNYSNYLKDNHKDIINESSVKIRQENIIKRLLFASPKSINVLELAQHFFVSESVIQNDGKVIANTIKRWNLTLIRRQRSICIKGKEKDIRSAFFI